MFFAAALGSQHGPWLDTAIAVLAVIGAALSITYSLRLLASTFFGPLRNDYPRQPHEPPPWMRFPIGFLALACVAVGILPALVIGPTLNSAAMAVLGAQVPDYNLAIWHGWTWPLLMSVVAMAGGIALYFGLRRFLATREGPLLSGVLSAKRLFETALVLATDTLPELQRHLFPERRLQVQLLALVVVAFGATMAAMAGVGSLAASLEPEISTPDPAFALLWLLGAVCAIGAATQAKFHRMMALIFSGGAGLVVCVSFVWLSAPDLAITQLLVESVTTMLILLGLRWLPKRISGLTPITHRARLRRQRDALVAAAVGIGVATLALAAMLHPVADTVSQFFLEHARPGAGGDNVVNVILVDFRGFDTLGEITVLTIVALTVFALLRRFRPAAESIGATKQQQDARLAQNEQLEPGDTGAVADYLAVPALLILLAVPFLILFGAHLFLRGHNLPGGGFAAGVTATIALLVLYMARGARWVEARLRVAPIRWMAVGLLLATGTGAASLLAGQPFLTSFDAHFQWPLLGTVHLASAVLFDLGVFLVVIGACSLMLVALAHQSLRRPVIPAGGTEDQS